jgi:hypothetical protein
MAPPLALGSKSAERARQPLHPASRRARTHANVKPRATRTLYGRFPLEKQIQKSNKNTSMYTYNQQTTSTTHFLNCG